MWLTSGETGSNFLLLLFRIVHSLYNEHTLHTPHQAQQPDKSSLHLGSFNEAPHKGVGACCVQTVLASARGTAALCSQLQWGQGAGQVTVTTGVARKATAHTCIVFLSLSDQRPKEHQGPYFVKVKNAEMLFQAV